MKVTNLKYIMSLQTTGLPSRSVLADEASREEGRRLRYQMSNLTAFERHKLLINHYVLYHPGSTATLQRDTWVTEIVFGVQFLE